MHGMWTFHAECSVDIHCSCGSIRIETLYGCEIYIYALVMTSCTILFICFNKTTKLCLSSLSNYYSPSLIKLTLLRIKCSVSIGVHGNCQRSENGMVTYLAGLLAS